MYLAFLLTRRNSFHFWLCILFPLVSFVFLLCAQDCNGVMFSSFCRWFPLFFFGYESFGGYPFCRSPGPATASFSFATKKGGEERSNPVLAKLGFRTSILYISLSLLLTYQGVYQMVNFSISWASCDERLLCL